MRFALLVFVFLALPAWAEEPFGDVVVRCLAQLKADPNASNFRELMDYCENKVEAERVSAGHKNIEALNSSIEIKTVVSSQDAEGATLKDLTPNFLAKYEAYAIWRIKEHAQKFRRAQGYPVKELKITSVGSIVENNGRKLLLLKIYSEDSQDAYMVETSAIIGTNFVRVACISKGSNIPITYGVCADKIKETFGWSP